MARISVDFDPRLVEECVLLRMNSASPGERIEFRRERDRIYDEADPELRERRFRALHRDWFTREGLGASLFQALAEQPLLRSAARILVLPAGKDEGADLHENRASAGAAPVLVIQVRPTTLVREDLVLPLLRRELMHVADMLDPTFGYERRAGNGPREKLVRLRYRVLWDTTVDGRLAACGWLSHDVIAQRRSEFQSLFPSLAQSFEALLENPRPAHAELWRLAENPSISSWGPTLPGDGAPHPSPDGLTAVHARSATRFTRAALGLRAP